LVAFLKRGHLETFVAFVKKKKTKKTIKTCLSLCLPVWQVQVRGGLPKYDSLSARMELSSQIVRFNV
jgi:hypothetical protein